MEGENIAGRYRVVRWLGGGGMGNVYEAIDAELGEPVALKVLGGELDDDAIERFRREVRLTRRIRHANVARMFDIGEHAGSRFLTMELVEGAALSSEPRPVPWARLQPIAQQICAGLAAAHAEGVVHRDLKPDNVLVERATGRAVVTDFGIARSRDDIAVTQRGMVIGTPRYMSPEQLAGDDADARSDLFALGVMLFELATGTRPWEGKSVAEVARARLAPPRPFAGGDCPAGFAAVVAQLMAISPSARPRDARAAADAIAACASDDATIVDAPAVPAVAALGDPTDATRRQRPARARPLAVAVAPFTAAEADAYLADGMVEDLIDTLSTTPALRVRPTGASGRDVSDPRELGRRLGVDFLVAGSVRRIPTGLRVAARLLGVADGFQVWARRTDTDEARVLALADELAAELARAMSTRAHGAGERPTDPRAVELYLRARAEMRLYWGAHIVAAADLLERAAALAPDSAPIQGTYAYAAAHAWVMRGTVETQARARVAIERALPSGHGDAFLASSVFLINHGDPGAGARQLAIALARAPMSPHAHESAGRLLAELGALPEARQHLETASGLDPGRAPVIAAELARLDALEGAWPAADARLAPLIAAPQLEFAQIASVYQLRVCAWRRNFDGMEAAAATLGGDARSGDSSSPILQFCLAVLAAKRLDPAAWAALFAALDAPAMPRRAPTMSLQILAELAELVGDRDRSFQALAECADRGLLDVAWLDRCPLFADFDAARLRPIRENVAARAGRVLAAFRAAAGS